MKKMKRILMVTVGLAATVASNSADRRNFWLLNNTGRTITRFYMHVHGAYDPWSRDVLDGAMLPNALGTAVFFYDSTTSCWYDFRVGYSDGTYQDYLLGRNLCRTQAIQFNSNTNDAY